MRLAQDDEVIDTLAPDRSGAKAGAGGGAVHSMSALPLGLGGLAFMRRIRGQCGIAATQGFLIYPRRRKKCLSL
jgi:proteasome assembly chaperone (PAC2) family protein